MANTVTIEQIEQGTTLIPVFKIYQNGTNPYILNDLDNVKVWFIESKSNKVLKKYSKNALIGHDNNDFIVVNSELGTFKINIQSAVTKLWNEGIIRFEISILDTVSGFTDWQKIVKENIFSVKTNEISEI